MKESLYRKGRRAADDRAGESSQLTVCTVCGKPAHGSFLSAQGVWTFKHIRYIKSPHRPLGHKISATTYCERER